MLNKEYVNIIEQMYVLRYTMTNRVVTKCEMYQMYTPSTTFSFLTSIGSALWCFCIRNTFSFFSKVVTDYRTNGCQSRGSLLYSPLGY